MTALTDLAAEVLPCPFCGSPAEATFGACPDRDSDAVNCTSKDCDAASYFVGRKTWNTRATRIDALAQGEPVACHGMRRKGTEAIIGIIPNNIAARPATVQRYLDEYEEVPLYTHPAPPALSAEEREALERLERLADGRDYCRTISGKSVALAVCAALRRLTHPGAKS